MYASLVAVIHHRDVVGKFLDDADLFLGEGRAAGCDDIAQSQLVHRDYIYIALGKEALVRLGNLPLGKPDAVKGPTFDIDGSLWRIDIFGYVTVIVQRPAAVRDDAPGHGMYGEHRPLMETVRHPAVFGLDAQARLHQVLSLIAFGERCVRERRPA